MTWFRRLVRLLPADFQADYARDMERMFASQRRAASDRGAVSVMQLWFETVRDVLRTAPREHMLQIGQDVRFACRMMARRPALSLVTTLVLAIGIGATTAVFSIVDAAVLRPVPYAHSDRLVAIREQTPQDTNPWDLSYVSYRELRREARSFDHLAAYMRNGVVIGGPEPILTDAVLISANLLETLRVRPLAGRGFTGDEDAPRGAAVALIGYDLAWSRFGSAEAAVGQSLAIDNRATTIVGVLPDTFRFPDPDIDVWLPIGQLADEPWMRNRSVHVALVVGRLAAAVSLEAARAELDAWSRALQLREPAADFGHHVVIKSLAEQVSGAARPAVTALAGAVVVLLLVTGSSVGLLFLTRAAGRADEVSIRLSLGASRARLVRQFVTESLCAAAAGAALGVAAAYFFVAFLVGGLADALPPFVVPAIDGPALSAAAVCTVVVALIAGIVPAATAMSFVKTAAAAPSRTRKNLVLVQVAVSCVLVVVATLLGRSLDRLLRVDLGFRPDHLLVMRVTAPNALYQAPGAMTRFYESASARLRRLPGVSTVGVVNKPPVDPGSIGDLTIEGEPRRTAPIVTYRRVLPGYFRTLGIRLIEGRDFTERDGIGEAVTIVSASVARQFWPAGQAIGRRIKIGPADREPWMRIIGVVADVRNQSLEGGFDFAAYEPHSQRPWNGMFLVLRTTGDPSSMADAVRRALRELEPQVLISSLSTMDERIAESVASRRFHAVVVGAFAATTLLLVALAIYGVVGAWVTSHTRDLGIRAAVGASSSDLWRTVMAEGLRPAVSGLALGLCGGWIAASAARTLLFEVEAHDPAVFGVTCGLLLTIAFASSWVPARRAARIDPSRALRSE